MPSEIHGLHLSPNPGVYDDAVVTLLTGPGFLSTAPNITLAGQQVREPDSCFSPFPRAHSRRVGPDRTVTPRVSCRPSAAECGGACTAGASA